MPAEAIAADLRLMLSAGAAGVSDVVWLVAGCGLVLEQVLRWEALSRGRPAGSVLGGAVRPLARKLLAELEAQRGDSRVRIRRAGFGAHSKTAARQRVALRGARFERAGAGRLVHDRLELLRVGAVGVDADHGEGLVFELVDERPLVGPTGPSGHSDLLPEVEQHHLSAVVAQLEANIVLVDAFDIGRLLADGETAKSE